MTDHYKEQERIVLQSTIRRMTNILRGSVDSRDFKQYVLGMLSYRFISENLSSHINAKQIEAGVNGFDYAKITDTQAESYRKVILAEKGFFIYPSELFENVHKNASAKANLGETLAEAFTNIENSAKGMSSENQIKGLFSGIEANSYKLGVIIPKCNELLRKLLDVVGNLQLGNYGDTSVDILGEAYEYLTKVYTAKAGTSGGEFFTPPEVAELLVKIVTVDKTEVTKVYDPTCGSGSLLLQFAKVFGKENVCQGFFGQEINPTIYNLCRINMLLHNISYKKFNIAYGDTLTKPKHWHDEPFEAIIANPPYSIKWDRDPLLINDQRFKSVGILAPKDKADFAFVMHILSWLATDGTAAIVSFPSIMYRSGIEQKTRKYLIDNNLVDCIIQLPPDLFLRTSITTYVLIIKKNKSDHKTLFINASTEFKRGAVKNRLTEANIDKILYCFTKRTTTKYFSQLVDNSEIAKRDYNLSVGKYVPQPDNHEVVDIAALNAQLSQIVEHENKLRREIDAITANMEDE